MHRVIVYYACIEMLNVNSTINPRTLSREELKVASTCWYLVAAASLPSCVNTTKRVNVEDVPVRAIWQEPPAASLTLPCVAVELLLALVFYKRFYSHP